MKKQYRYWGKADGVGDNPKMHLLLYHCLDVSAVGKEYLRKNSSIAENLANGLGLENEYFSQVFCFFLALHDIGKFAASFQNLKPDLRLLLNIPSKKNYHTRHDALAWWLWDDCLRSALIEPQLSGLKRREARYISRWFDIWMRLAAGHHGKPVDSSLRCRDQFAKIDIEAATIWAKECYSFFAIQQIFDARLIVGKDEINKLKICSWQLAGIFTLCDWLGSNTLYFPFNAGEESVTTYWHKSCAQASSAITQSGQAVAKLAPDVSMKSLFPDFCQTPTPLQSLCDSMEIPLMPQCWILEDVTGAGKTEAALLLAGKIAVAGLADGVFIGLPTMATSNAMYGRMAKCYRKLFSNEKIPSLILAHGSRHLSKEFQNSILADWSQGDSRDNSADTMEAQCARWLADSSKKAFLADLGVGSLDQVLLAAMPVRHQSLRWCGLVRKVLIVDEVHAYDDYMLQILAKELEGLAAAGASVVLLSATLPFKTRDRLLRAFYSGRGGSPEDIIYECTGYPLVSAIGRNEAGEVFALEEEIETRESVRRELAVELIDSKDKVIEQVRIAIATGKCLCWIRNTVADAWAAFTSLQRDNIVSKDRLHLFHSRFAMGDRLDIENDILEFFGKKSRGDTRCGRILIATQVVEQSLDLDFDILISDLAPIDFLIQRAGRLHRHLRNEFGNPVQTLTESANRPKPTFFVYGPTPAEQPEIDWFSKKFRGAAYVYEDTAVLWQTQQLLKTYGKIQMPDMAREFIEGVYGKDCWDTPEIFTTAKNRVEGKHSGKRSMGDFNSISFRQGYSQGSSARWAEEEQIPTRLGADQQRVYLAVYSKGRLKPLNQGEFGWDKSSLQIRLGSLQEMVLTEDEDIAVAELKKNSRKFYESDLIVVLNREGSFWGARGKSRNGNTIFINYDSIMGWQLREEKP